MATKSTSIKKTAPKAVRKRTTASGSSASGVGLPEIDARIRRRAYELYLERGRQPGLDLQNWLDAERELLGRQERT